MKASLCMLSAVIAVGVAHATTLAQYRPDLSFPPNWQPGPGGAIAYPQARLSGPGGVPAGSLGAGGPDIPGIGKGYFGANGPGSITPRPSEPMVGDFLKGQSNPPPNPGAEIPPAVLESLLNNPKPNLDNIPLPPPAPVVPRPIPVAERSWLSWDWTAGILLLCVLSGLFLASSARKQSGSDAAPPLNPHALSGGEDRTMRLWKRPDPEGK
jgi:hypothetical protein